MRVSYRAPQMEIIHLVSEEAILADYDDNNQTLSGLVPKV